MRLSTVAQAVIRKAKGGEICTLCNGNIPSKTPFVIGSSLDKDYGYIGGLFHCSCWLSRNYHPQNERILKMTEQNPNDLGIPNLKRLGDLVPTDTPWTYTHTQLLNQEFIITGFTTITTQFGDALLADCIVNEEKCKVLIGGKVLCEQLIKVERNLPVITTLIKQGKYYLFT